MSEQDYYSKNFTCNRKLHTKFGTATLHSLGYYVITSKKEGHHNKKLHRLIFEDFYNMTIPRGYVIHHKNGCKTDNCILNLQLLKSSEHNHNHMDGKNNHFYGKTHSKEVKQKISAVHKGRKCSEELRKFRSERIKGDKHPKWGTSIIDEWGGIWFLKEMKKQVKTLSKLEEYTGIQQPLVCKYLKRRGLRWINL